MWIVWILVGNCRNRVPFEPVLEFRAFYAPEYAIGLLRNVPNGSKSHRKISKCSKIGSKRPKIRDRTQTTSRALWIRVVLWKNWDSQNNTDPLKCGCLIVNGLWTVFGAYTVAEPLKSHGVFDARWNCVCESWFFREWFPTLLSLQKRVS